MLKSKALSTPDGQIIQILYEDPYTSLKEVMKKNRNITDDIFFSPSLSDLHDPYLMPDMEKAVKRILEAREKKERVVIFGDYDVDGVSSTAILFRFLTEELGMEVSYRLPHRVHDGYGLKSYFFDELAEKYVKLVITVDCGTRDIEPIGHAKSLGIDVIVTDHHAVPDIIPEEVIAILNPKRKDSQYPFPNLAGAGVAFKLLHALAIATTSPQPSPKGEGVKNAPSPSLKEEGLGDKVVSSTLTRYIDFASLGTVADCMPLIGENRIITALGLKQMKNSDSSALKRYIEDNKKNPDGDADIIGFGLGPRINAAGRMDSPLKALHWLLATEEKVDEWLLEVESLNTKRQEEVKKYTEDALMNVDLSLPILFYTHDHIEHGLIGLVAGRLTEAYGKPSIVLCRQHENKRAEVKKREYEKEVEIRSEEVGGRGDFGNSTSYLLPPSSYVASCRSPEWCNLVELLDECKEYFVRYGGHRQAAGFTIEANRLTEFQKVIAENFAKKYDIANLPKKTIKVECILDPGEVSLTTLDMIDTFRPFGIGNSKPLFLLENLTITEVKQIGQQKNHLSLIFAELPNVKCLLWNYTELFGGSEKGSSQVFLSPPSYLLPSPGDILSPIVSLERNIWNGRSSVQMMMKNICA